MSDSIVLAAGWTIAYTIVGSKIEGKNRATHDTLQVGKINRSVFPMSQPKIPRYYVGLQINLKINFGLSSLELAMPTHNYPSN